MSSTSQQLPCTDRENKRKDKVDGNAIYLYSLFILMFLVVVFKGMLDRERIYVTYDHVDDTLVESLLSASVINREEYSLGGHTVIYRTFTPEDIAIPDALLPVIPQIPFDPLDNTEIFSPSGDGYLEQAYEKFMDTLRQNLKLDASMNATISGIRGVVSIDDFSIYNVYRAYDDDGNQTGYRVVKYTKLQSGGWSCYPYNANTPVDVYNSVDHTHTSVGETSVSATISFDVALTDIPASLNTGLTEDTAKQHVSYSRIVDVKRN